MTTIWSEWAQTPSGRRRARGLGLAFAGEPGEHNGITDVPGVEVGYTTLVSGDGAHVAGVGPVRTGVTVILPRGRFDVGEACAAGVSVGNGNGEMTGGIWIEESGTLSSPIGLTNTHAVGSVHRGIIDWIVANHPRAARQWLLPVVAETWDGYLNDINGDHVTSEAVRRAFEAATSGAIEEGSVGGGTGMNCYGFKAGSGTASRRIDFGGREYVVGAFLQCNFGSRRELLWNGVPLGRRVDVPDDLGSGDWFGGDLGSPPPGSGSVIAVIATDAPILPGQAKALARRVPFGLARTGTTGSHFSGDIFLAFSTANRGALTSRFPDRGKASAGLASMEFIPWGYMDTFFEAVVQSVEESVLNALVANTDMVGRDGRISRALPHDQLVALLQGTTGLA